MRRRQGRFLTASLACGLWLVISGCGVAPVGADDPLAVGSQAESPQDEGAVVAGDLAESQQEPQTDAGQTDPPSEQDGQTDAPEPPGTDTGGADPQVDTDPQVDDEPETDPLDDDVPDSEPEPNDVAEPNTVQAETVPRFAIDVVAGRRPLTATGTVVVDEAETLPEGRWEWRLNDVLDVGPTDTHCERSVVLRDGGEHVVSLRFMPQGAEAWIDCLEVETGQPVSTVVVWPQIVGRVLNAKGGTMAGVVVSADNGGTSAVTNSNGTFKVDVPFNWSGTISPQLDGGVFDPPSRSYTRVVVDLSDQDFSDTPHLVTISGHVRDSDGEPLAGIVLAATEGGEDAATDATGFYQLNVEYDWYGTVGPAPSSHVLWPSSRSYTKLVLNQTDQDFTGGTYALSNALASLQSLPTWTAGPRVIPLIRSSYWDTVPQGHEVLREIARVGGIFMLGANGAAVSGANSRRVQLAIELQQQGIPIWFEMGTIGGLGAGASHVALDPNYLHDTPDPPESYLDADDAPEATERSLVCPARHANRRQIARWFAGGRAIREAGLGPQQIAGVFVHEETVYLASRCIASGSVPPDLYAECSACGSAEEHDRLLAELHADILHAMLRGMGVERAGDLNRDGLEDDLDWAIFQQAVLDQDPIGDFNDDGVVDDQDQAVLAQMPEPALKEIERFWWGSGYRDVEGGYDPPPWLPIEDYPDVPRQTYCSRSYYMTGQDALIRLANTIDHSVDIVGRPFAALFSLTYDGTVMKETGVDPELNRQKAQVAVGRGCPLVFCYSLNPPDKNWMTADLFQNQFESLLAIVEGSRPE